MHHVPTYHHAVATARDKKGWLTKPVRHTKETTIETKTQGTTLLNANSIDLEASARNASRMRMMVSCVEQFFYPDGSQNARAKRIQAAS
jgi:hypothetical protein